MILFMLSLLLLGYLLGSIPVGYLLANYAGVGDLRASGSGSTGATNVVRRGLSGLFGIGTLQFSSASGEGIEVAFQAIRNAQSVKDIVTRLQD